MSHMDYINRITPQVNFTPTKLAGDMLDLLPKDIWGNPDAKVLNPCCKRGVLLDETFKRFMDGLEHAIPDAKVRAKHVLENQLYAFCGNEKHAWQTRKNLYGDKNTQGNVMCVDFCNSKEDLKMKFDVIIGNPPYQKMAENGSGAFATPLYHKFIQQAKKHQPKYLNMVVPARWYTGGIGLGDFREEMLNDKSITHLVDYQNDGEVFKDVSIKGGVCYFLWDRDNPTPKCNITTVIRGEKKTSQRPLKEPGLDVFVRDETLLGLYKKVQAVGETSFARGVSVPAPFGLETNYFGRIEKTEEKPIKIYTTHSVGYVSEKDIVKNHEAVDKYKVYLPKAGGSGSTCKNVLGRTILGKPGDCCSGTYIILGVYDDEQTARNVEQYVNTKFFRAMVKIKKITHDNCRRVFEPVPMQDFSETWTDEKLYKKYKLSDHEIDWIETNINPRLPD